MISDNPKPQNENAESTWPHFGLWRAQILRLSLPEQKSTEAGKKENGHPKGGPIGGRHAATTQELAQSLESGTAAVPH